MGKIGDMINKLHETDQSIEFLRSERIKQISYGKHGAAADTLKRLKLWENKAKALSEDIKQYGEGKITTVIFTIKKKHSILKFKKEFINIPEEDIKEALMLRVLQMGYEGYIILEIQERSTLIEFMGTIES